MTSDMKNRIQKIFLLLFTFFFVLIIGELVLAYPVYYFFKEGKSSYYKSYANRVALNPYLWVKADPLLGYIPRENVKIKKQTPSGTKIALRKNALYDYQSNKYGFRYRDDLTQDKPIEETRVFCLGGSTTMGSESPNNMTYPQQLENLIGDPTVRVINAGVGAYRSIHLLHYYKEHIRKFSPDIITIYSGWNDFEGYLWSSWGPRDPRAHFFLSQFEVTQHPGARFAFGNLILKTYYRLTNVNRFENNLLEAVKSLEWQEEYRINIQELISLAKSEGVIPVLINFPSPHFENAPLEAIEFSDKDLAMAGRWNANVASLRATRKIIKKLAHENNISLIDVNERFEKENSDFKKKFSYFVDRMHLTPEGNTLIGETILPSIKNILKVRNQ